MRNPSRKNYGAHTLRLTLAFALFWAWQTGINYIPIGENQPVGSFWYMSNAFVFCVWLAAFAFAGFVKKVSASRAFVAILAFVWVAAVCLQSICGHSSFGDEVLSLALMLVRHIFTAIGTTGFAIVLFERFACFDDARDRDFLVLMGTLASLFFCLTMANLGNEARGVLTLLLPLALASILAKNDGEDRSRNADSEIVGADRAGVDRAGMSACFGPKCGTSRMLAIVAVFALSLNFIRLQVEGALGGEIAGAPATVARIVLIFVVIAALEFTWQKPVKRLSAPVLVFLITLAVVFVLLRSAPFLASAETLVSAGYLYYVTLLWRMAANFARGNSFQRVRSFLLVFACNAFGLLLGTVFSHAASCLSGVPDSIPLFLVSYAVFVLGFVLAKFDFLSTTKKGVGNSGGFSGNAEDEICQRVSIEYGLTSKEAEVLSLVVSRRSLREMAVGMGVSVNTVKTHVAHVYQKLDVHSREEVIELVGSRESDFPQAP